MSAPAPFLRPAGPSAVTDADTSPRRTRLTRRAELLIYVLAFTFGLVSIPLGVWWT